MNANVNEDYIVSEQQEDYEDKISPEHQQNVEFHHHKDSNKQDLDTEVVSCYCSASHTDNISTDEHDSLRDSHTTVTKPVLPKGLQSSDSGADLTEYSKNELDGAWHKFWSVNGERLIWDSWIFKYSDYINPEYLQHENKLRETNDQQSIKFSFETKDLENFALEKQEGSSLKFSSSDYLFYPRFKSVPIQEFSVECTRLNKIEETSELKDCSEEYKSRESTLNHCGLVRTISSSDSYDKLHTEISEGWNPLSPASVDNEIEAERLLSSRCASHISGSIRTIDSMTNVTRMTVSSFDLSDNSKTSDSISSVSSVQSSLSSTSSEEAEDSNDYERQWNILWKSHYEEMYWEQYNKFMCACCEHSLETLSVNVPSNCSTLNSTVKVKSNLPSIKRIKEILKLGSTNVEGAVRSKRKKTEIHTDDGNLDSNPINVSDNISWAEDPERNVGESVIALQSNTAKDLGESEGADMNFPLSIISLKGGTYPQQRSNAIKSHKEETKKNLVETVKSVERTGKLLEPLKANNSVLKSNEFKSEVHDLYKYCEASSDENEDFINEMKLLDLPISFLGKSRPAKRKNLNRSNKNLPELEDTTNHIKAAFNLLGIEFQEKNQPSFTGHVDYKMKHIRLQNRQLKIHYLSAMKMKNPKHTYFDDDGNEVPQEKMEEVQMILPPSDNSENVLTTSSNEDEAEANKSSISPQEFTCDLEKSEDNVQPRKKKRKRKITLPVEIKENPKLRKYWHKRFSLFSKFDMGIKMDEESWYSVTPEAVAKHTAERLRCDVIVDAFCGAGGNSIQFAQTCEKVIAIDIDPHKIELARNNAEIYGVANRIEFIVGDFMELYNKLEADVVFLSPPWGGPSYVNNLIYDLEEYLQPVPLSKLLTAAQNITDDIALFLPRNSDTYALVNAAGPEGSVEIEQNFINKKLIAITAYFNNLIKTL